MKRIIIHWTAGAYEPNDTDRKAYHILIDGDGNEHKGFYNIEANVNTKDGHYAAHTAGCNTGSIGISACCMHGAKEKPLKLGDYPLKIEQWNGLVKAAARLCKEYGIPVTRETVLSHAEVQGTLGIPQKAKWDITVLAFDDSIKGATAIGDRFRAEVRTLLAQKPKRDPLKVEPKPVLAHRRVQTLLGSLAGGGGIASWFAGFSWELAAVFLAFGLVLALVFIFLYREEIRAGLFAPRKK